MARPNKYETEVKDKLILVEGWARDGLTNEQIAANLGINVGTLYEWKNKYPELADALKKGKEVVDYQVENALFKSALDGNVTAQIFWLKNRQSNKWRDKHEYDNNIGNKDGKPFEIDSMTPEERRARIDELNRKRGEGASSTS